jgi:Secretion system C-terminal sorting domain
MSRPFNLILFSLAFSLTQATSFAQVINTAAGNGTSSFGGDTGPATAASMVSPWGVAVSPSGYVYISDQGNNRVRSINTTGLMGTAVGTGVAGYSGDSGPAAAARINTPRGVAEDRSGNMYIADQNNNVVRKVSSSGIISTFAGNGTSGYSGDNGPAVLAKLSFPQAVAADKSGNVYIADLNQVIRRVSTLGVITTIAGHAGTTGYSGDGGPATAATFNNIYGLCVDTSGNIYIADNGNNVIRKINTAGVISTYAGNSTAGYSGDNGPATAAELNSPMGVTTNKAQELYIADQTNNVIRKVTVGGTIITFAATGIAGYTGDHGYAILARINSPAGITCDTSGNVYFADNGNFVVRKISVGNRAPAFTRGTVFNFALCEDATAYGIDTMLSIRDSNVGQNEAWSHFYGPHHGTVSGSYATLSTDSVITPSGFTYTPATGFSGYDTVKFRVTDGSLSDTILIRILVNPTPPLSFIGGPSYACVGRSDTLTDTASGGTWAISNSLATISAGGVVTAHATGTDTISYHKVMAGCVNTVSKAIIIFPTSTTITGGDLLCIYHMTTLDATPAGGAWTTPDTLATVTDGVVNASYPGNDTIIYTISNSCGVFSASHTLVINDIVIPYVLITARPGYTIHPGQTDTLAAETPGATGLFRYQWQKNGFNIAGATDSVYISNDFANNDSITCLVYDVPCTFYAFGWAYIEVNDLNVSGTVLPANSIHLFPNPNDGRFRIIGTVARTDKEATIELVNIVGQVVYEDVAAVQNGAISKEMEIAQGLPDGMYLLRISVAEGSEVLRLMVRH